MKQSRILTNAGIPLFELRRLYRFGLVDSIQCVSGIGQSTYAKIRQDLDNDGNIARVPEDRRWLYSLALDVLGVERDANLLVRKQPGGSCLLDEMQDVDTDSYNRCKQALTTTLPRRDRNILIDYYRGNLPLANLAQKHRCSQSDIMETIRRAIGCIRDSKAMSTPLFQAVFHGDQSHNKDSKSRNDDSENCSKDVRDYILDYVKTLR